MSSVLAHRVPHEKLNMLALAIPFLTGAVLASDINSGSFSLQVEKRYGRPDFVREWLAAHRKWGHQVPIIDQAHMPSVDDDTIPISPLPFDSIYVSDVNIGNPPQTLKLALDTGSSDLWVQSTDTEYRVNLNGPWPPQYRPNASETSELVQDADWGVLYVDGSNAHGIVYRDTVRMGAFVHDNVSVQSAETIAASFERQAGLSGILGMAWTLPSNVDPPAPRFLDILAPTLEMPVFACDLRKNETGSIDFGFINDTRTSGDLVWLDALPDSPFWDIALDLTSWDGTNNTWYSHDFVGTVDTGTTLLFLPDSLVNMYWFSVPGVRVYPSSPETYIFPCDLSDSLPDLMFKIAEPDRILTIPGTYFDFGPLDEGPSYCWGGLQSADGFSTSILGSTMLKAFYVAFDIDKGQVGFADKDLGVVD